MKISAGIFHLECLCLLLNNHGTYGQAETTAKFSASNWSKTNPPRFSDCRLVMLYRGVKIQPGLATFLSPRFFVFACPSSTSNPINKRRLQRDSAHQTGLKPTLHAFLIVVESGHGGG